MSSNREEEGGSSSSGLLSAAPSAPTTPHPESSRLDRLPALSPAPSTSSLPVSPPHEVTANPNTTTTGLAAPLLSRIIPISHSQPLPQPLHHNTNRSLDLSSESLVSSCLNFKGGDCLVCYTSYESEGDHTPVFFHCGHSICKRCSERLQEPCPNTFASSRRKVRCPTCFTFSPFPLIKNFELINLLDANQLSSKALAAATAGGASTESGEIKVCENCDRGISEGSFRVR
jgi:hypothetical protein